MKKRSAFICATACVFGLTACESDLGARMEVAALNTVIGMGTVFAVLIIIIGVISLFRFIPMIQDRLAGKKKAAAMQENADTQIVESQENTDVSDDLELVAVIAAAIAASEGAASTDGFVVRSIRKVNRTRRA
ncbi:MAG: OadG family protein [Acetatifactor sp.]|nr:OadG family protein [Acetatifactor sp.]